MPELQSLASKQAIDETEQPKDIYICDFSNYDSDTDQSFDPDSVILEDDEAEQKHTPDWISTLSRDDLMSFCIVLFYILIHLLKLSQMDAAKMIANIKGKGERTIHGWRVTFLVTNGTFPDSQWGKFERSGVLWQNEDLNKQVIEKIMELKVNPT